MIERSYDAKLLAEAYTRRPNYEPSQDLDWEDWLAKKQNVMLVDELGNVGIAAEYFPGVYTGHWFFNSRGKEAMEVAKQMLRVMFEDLDIKLMRGLTPVELRGACILARKIGFTSHGILEYPDGETCELFCLTKEDFERMYN